MEFFFENTDSRAILRPRSCAPMLIGTASIPTERRHRFVENIIDRRGFCPIRPIFFKKRSVRRGQGGVCGVRAVALFIERYRLTDFFRSHAHFFWKKGYETRAQERMGCAYGCAPAPGQSQGMPRMRRQYRSKVSRRWLMLVPRAALPLASQLPSEFLYNKNENT